MSDLRKPVKGEHAALAVLVVVAALGLLTYLFQDTSWTDGAGEPERRQPAASQTQTAPEPAPAPDPVSLDAKVDRCSRDGEYTLVGGSVLNNGERAARFVTVEVKVRDSAGQVVDTGTTYAVGSEYLRPGESSRWRWMSRAPGVARCEARVQDYRAE